MNYLVLDTSTEGATVGVSANGHPIVSANIELPRRHGRDLVPRLRDVLEQAGLRPMDLDLIAAGLGPGSFTGLRIGLAAAKTLAYAAEAAILGIDSLEGIAANAPPDVLRVSVIADAQRGDLYTADFHREVAGQPLKRMSPTRIESLTDWNRRIEPGTYAIGPALDSPKLQPQFSERLIRADSALNRPDAASLLAVASSAWEQGRRCDLWSLEPLYLRRSAAEEQWDRLSTSRPVPRQAPPQTTDCQHTS